MLAAQTALADSGEGGGALQLFSGLLIGELGSIKRGATLNGLLKVVLVDCISPAVCNHD